MWLDESGTLWLNEKDVKFKIWKPNKAVTLTVLSADPVNTNGLFPVDWKHAIADTFFVCPARHISTEIKVNIRQWRCEKGLESSEWMKQTNSINKKSEWDN